MHSDIATSAAVSELRGVVVLSALLISSLVSFSSVPVGFVLILLLDSIGNLSVESVSSMYGTIGWIIIVEFCLFLGIFVSAVVISFSVPQIVLELALLDFSASRSTGLFSRNCQHRSFC